MSSGKLIILGLGAVILAGLFLWNSLAPKNTQAPAPITNTVPTTKPSLVEQDKTGVLSSAAYDLSQPQVLGVIPQGSLAKEISGLIINGATNLKIHQIKFPDGATGFSVAYELPGNVEQAYSKIFTATRIFKWNIKSGGRTENFASLDMEQKSWLARTSFSQKDNGVSAEILVKEAKRE